MLAFATLTLRIRRGVAWRKELRQKELREPGIEFGLGSRTGLGDQRVSHVHFTAETSGEERAALTALLGRGASSVVDSVCA